ncbi:MAG TPA: hypothetical protein VKQ72_09365, partial [Aggregatilineales bacterium]|nr:hypothetical protein [Aggregatilineales bacterium]
YAVKMSGRVSVRNAGFIGALIVANLIVLMVWFSLRQAPVAVLPTVAALPTLLPASATSTATISSTETPTPTATPTSTSTETQTPSLTPTGAPATIEPSQQASVTPLSIQIRIKAQNGTQARSGPGISYGVVSQVDVNTEYPVRAYGTDYFGYTWYLVDLPNGKPAWILAPAAEIASIAGTKASANAQATVEMAQTIPPTPTLTPTLTLTPPASDQSEVLLQEVPIFSGIGPNLHAIYAKGQQLGNNPHAFAKVGDCNTKSDAFLNPIDHGLIRLGYYGALGQVIDNFKGSFGRDSIAAQVGLNSASVQDSFLADSRFCKANEAPLDCEYRISQPSIALIMFGANDVGFFTPEMYRRYMSQIIEKSIADGVIPVLMTFTWHDHGALYDKMLQFNLIAVNLAQQYQIPLINFWLASQYLPGHGIVPDNAHLTWSVNGLDFTGEQTVWGQTLRSLLALEMLGAVTQELDD